jgi:hypothetical protein
MANSSCVESSVTLKAGLRTRRQEFSTSSKCAGALECQQDMRKGSSSFRTSRKIRIAFWTKMSCMAGFNTCTSKVWRKAGRKASGCLWLLTSVTCGPCRSISEVCLVFTLRIVLADNAPSALEPSLTERHCLSWRSVTAVTITPTMKTRFQPQ